MAVHFYDMQNSLNNINLFKSDSIGEQSYGAIEYKGTWFVTESTANDYIGFVFGYQNNRKFYLAMWKRAHSNYDATMNYRSGIKGIQLKVTLCGILLTLLHSERPKLCAILVFLSATGLKLSHSFCLTCD